MPTGKSAEYRTQAFCIAQQICLSLLAYGPAADLKLRLVTTGTAPTNKETP
jgi:hypothetical protein